MASHGPPGVLPARTTFRWWLYSVDTVFEFASINVFDRVWDTDEDRGGVMGTGSGDSANDVAATPDVPRVATPAERAQLWPIATEAWPAYDDYQAKTTREIPLVICEPR